MNTLNPAPELLAPAGDWDCIRAAVENGADAVYFGLEDGFNARARATNFDLSNIADIMLFLHRRGVKGYVTLNTLAFSDELPHLQTIIRRLALAPVDAVLVQDLGVARMIREITHDLAIHASTQMTLTSAECIAVAEQLGIQRVVLPRELSIDEILQIHITTKVELEAFVHGALCVAYSGQCLTSESLGGRSANRGQCAQACRLPYELLCDGELRDFGDQKYLLSPQDLAAFALTPQLIAAGVRCFKIEGRLKTPEYVANITRHYREAIDNAVAGHPVQFTRRQIQQMEQSFSRGFSPGWLQGCDHKMLVPATSSSKRGVLLGRIEAVHFDRVTVQLEYVVQAGDGVQGLAGLDDFEQPGLLDRLRLLPRHDGGPHAPGLHDGQREGVLCLHGCQARRSGEHGLARLAYQRCELGREQDVIEHRPQRVAPRQRELDHGELPLQ
ncbi:MAG: peptidase U32 family protein, partial [Planctomycetota bacterium]